METCNIKEYPPNSASRIHLEAEIAKLAYAARNPLIGNPKFSQQDLRKYAIYSVLSI